MRDEKLDLDAIEARAQAATEGPWESGRENVQRLSDAGEWIENVAENLLWNDDAEFIAHARTDVPALVARVRELEAESERRRQDRADALNVTSRDGLLASEWVARTGKSERERDAAIARAEAAEADVERLRSRTECSGREVDLTDPNDACQSARVHFARAERAEAELAGANERGALVLEAKNQLLAEASALLKKAEAARMEVKDCPNCAAMREALEGVSANANDPARTWAIVNAALAPDAGRALLTELAALREVAEVAREARRLLVIAIGMDPVDRSGTRMAAGDLCRALDMLDALKAGGQ